jgi:hypothetical protein
LQKSPLQAGAAPKSVPATGRARSGALPGLG